MEIRHVQPGDAARLEHLYAQAFPAEDLWPLVKALHAAPINIVSLVATEHDETSAPLIAHVCFTFARVEGDPRRFALLGPLAVAPEHQRHGIGSAIVRAGFGAVRDAGVSRVFVLGDPAYYGRFGFVPERATMTPCPIPADWAAAWQSKSLDGDEIPASGRIELPSPWLEPGLWAP